MEDKITEWCKQFEGEQVKEEHWRQLFDNVFTYLECNDDKNTEFFLRSYHALRKWKKIKDRRKELFENRKTQHLQREIKKYNKAIDLLISLIDCGERKGNTAQNYLKWLLHKDILDRLEGQGDGILTQLSSPKDIAETKKILFFLESVIWSISNDISQSKPGNPGSINEKEMVLEICQIYKDVFPGQDLKNNEQLIALLGEYVAILRDTNNDNASYSSASSSFQYALQNLESNNYTKVA